MATTPTNYGTLSFITKRLSSSSLQRNPSPCFSLPHSDTNYINNNTTTRSSFLHRKPLVHITKAIGNNGLIPTTKSGDDQELRKGAEVLVEALEHQGVTYVFSYRYPETCLWDIHEAAAATQIIISKFPYNRQGVVFAADGYARASNSTGVCLLGTSDSDVIKVLAKALLDSIPIVVIYNSELPKEDEDENVIPPLLHDMDIPYVTPVSKEEIIRVTKQDFHVLDAGDIPRIVRDAFHLAQSGHPGPVSIDIPKDVQKQLVRVFPNCIIALPGHPGSVSINIDILPKDIQKHLVRVYPKWNGLPPPPPLCVSTDHDELYNNIVRIVSQSKKPVLYVGGGCLRNSTDELKRFVELTGIPAITATTAATTLMEICVDHDELFLGMPGTVSADYAADHSDLLLAIGVVRLDDPKIEAFVSRCGGEIVHIDIDRLDIDVGSKIKQPITSVCVDIKLALKGINRLFESTPRFSFSAWKEELNNMNPMRLIETSFGQEAISPQYAIQVLNDLTKGRAIIATGAGKYQAWVAQCYNYRGLWITTSSTDFGLIAAAGAAAAKPHTTVVDIEDYGSFYTNVLMNTDLKDLPIKIMLLDNYQQQLQHVLPSKEYESVHILSSQDMLQFARSFDIPAASVTKKGELREAIGKMLESPGMYLLDVIVPQDEELMVSVLPSHNRE